MGCSGSSIIEYNLENKQSLRKFLFETLSFLGFQNCQILKTKKITLKYMYHLEGNILLQITDEGSLDTYQKLDKFTLLRWKYLLNSASTLEITVAVYQAG